MTEHVPNWQLLLLLYFVLVAIPVMLVHARMKKSLLQEKSVKNILRYIIAVLVTAFAMHFITMWLYFGILFKPAAA